MASGSQISKIVLAFDSFKGSLTSLQAAAAARQAILAEAPGCEVVTVPVADGGEGTAEAVAAAFPGQTSLVEVEAASPLGAPVTASYRVLSGHVAVVDIASASGLTLLKPQERDPMAASSRGTGQLIAHAMANGCREIIIGLGGSATCDAATGILSALGYEFFDRDGAPVEPSGAALARVARISDAGADPLLKKCRFTLACDVSSPLLGPRGAARVYAPQKGATPAQVEELEAAMGNFAAALERKFGLDITQIPGAGAAGGAAGTLRAALGAKIVPGIKLVLDMARFDQIIAGTQLIITGEGSIDSQTGMGKAVSGVVARATRAGVPVVALGGSVSGYDQLLNLGAKAVLSIQRGPVSLEQAMLPSAAQAGVRYAVTQLIRLLK